MLLLLAAAHVLHTGDSATALNCIAQLRQQATLQLGSHPAASLLALKVKHRCRQPCYATSALRAAACLQDARNQLGMRSGTCQNLLQLCTVPVGWSHGRPHAPHRPPWWCCYVQAHASLSQLPEAVQEAASIMVHSTADASTCLEALTSLVQAGCTPAAVLSGATGCQLQISRHALPACARAASTACRPAARSQRFLVPLAQYQAVRWQHQQQPPELKTACHLRRSLLVLFAVVELGQVALPSDGGFLTGCLTAALAAAQAATAAPAEWEQLALKVLASGEAARAAVCADQQLKARCVREPSATREHIGVLAHSTGQCACELSV